MAFVSWALDGLADTLTPPDLARGQGTPQARARRRTPRRSSSAKGGRTTGGGRDRDALVVTADWLLTGKDRRRDESAGRPIRGNC